MTLKSNTEISSTQMTKEDYDKLMKTRRKRSVVLAIVLAAMVVMFYVLTVVKMGPGLFDRVL